MDERTLEALASGEPVGSGGPLTDDHVICPGCAHNFAAISQSSRDRIAELEAALTPFADIDGEDDADYPDGAQALLQFGRSSYHALSLGDLRRARKAMQNS